jgi:hypothetical protein
MSPSSIAAKMQYALVEGMRKEATQRSITGNYANAPESAAIVRRGFFLPLPNGRKLSAPKTPTNTTPESRSRLRTSRISERESQKVVTGKLATWLLDQRPLRIINSRQMMSASAAAFFGSGRRGTLDLSKTRVFERSSAGLRCPPKSGENTSQNSFLIDASQKFMMRTSYERMPWRRKKRNAPPRPRGRSSDASSSRRRRRPIRGGDGMERYTSAAS